MQRQRKTSRNRDKLANQTEKGLLPAEGHGLGIDFEGQSLPEVTATSSSASESRIEDQLRCSGIKRSRYTGEAESEKIRYQGMSQELRQCPAGRMVFGRVRLRCELSTCLPSPLVSNRDLVIVYSRCHQLLQHRKVRLNFHTIANSVARCSSVLSGNARSCEDVHSFQPSCRGTMR